MGTQEEWKPVVGYEGFYEVSDMGRVRSLPRKWAKGGILKPAPDEWGYSTVGLCKNGKRKTNRIHILVMQTFKGECPEGCEVDHIDGNPSNNCLENLRYVTHKENIHNPITKKRQKEASKKRSQDPEWLRKNAEQREKMYQDPEWRKSHAEAAKKLHQDPEWLGKVREGVKKLSQDFEWRRKQAEAVRKANSKPVNQYTLDGKFVKQWPSAKDAARELGINNRNISSCCNGIRKKAGGFKWKHVTNI